MKLITVTLLLLFFECCYGISGRPRPTTEIKVPATGKLPYELPGLNPIDLHSLRSCANEKDNGIPISAWIGPCWNTEYCQIPHCCGLISGRNSTFIMEYIAQTTFYNGIFNGNLAGACFGNEADGADCITIDLPFQIVVPTALTGYSRILSDATTVPQFKGETYKLEIPYQVVTTAVTTLGIKLDLVAQIVTKDKTKALCWALYGTLENIDLLESVVEVADDFTSLKVLDNSIGTVGKILPGLIPYTEPINIRKNLNFSKTKLTEA